MRRGSLIRRASTLKPCVHFWKINGSSFKMFARVKKIARLDPGQRVSSPLYGPVNEAFKNRGILLLNDRIHSYWMFQILPRAECFKSKPTEISLDCH